MKRPMAAIFIDGDSESFEVAETPSEVVDKLYQFRTSSFVELTLAHPEEKWNGRALYVRPGAVNAVGPPTEWTGDDDV